MLRIVVPIILLGLCFGGCKTRPAVGEASLDFAIRDTKNSILRDIMSSSGRIPVCVGFMAFSDSERKKASRYFRKELTKVANAWNGLLADHPHWPVKHKIVLDFHEQDQPCKARIYGFGVSVWRTDAAFQRDYCQNAPVCVSSTWPDKRLMIIGPSNRGVAADIYDYFTLLHEYGHLLALGDTYQVPGRSEWEGDQPPSVMNGNNHPLEKLTTDDRWGLWAVLAAILTGERSCKAYGSDVPMTVNAPQYVMCDPRSVARYSHRSISDLPKSKLVDRPDSPVATGIWRIGKWKPTETALLVMPGKSAKELLITSIHMGTIRAERGIKFDCFNSPENDGSIECAPTIRDDLRITFTSRTTGLLYREEFPDGIPVAYRAGNR